MRKLRIRLRHWLHFMLFIRQNLGSLEKTKEYNQKIGQYRCASLTRGINVGCIDSLACVYCYHVISDSICLCSGMFTCPNCGKSNGKLPSTIANNSIITNLISSVDTEEYSI